MKNPDEAYDLNNPDDYSAQPDTRPEAGSADVNELNERQFADNVAYRETDKTENLDANTDLTRAPSGNSALHPGEQPLTTQGSQEEIEENMGGTTNLSLDQLKQEHDPEGTPNR